MKQKSIKPFGPQKPPQDYRIFRGSVNEFFDSAARKIEKDKVLEEDADREMIGDDVGFGLGPIGNK